MSQWHGTSRPQFFARNVIDLLVLTAAFATSLPFFLVAAAPFLQGL